MMLTSNCPNCRIDIIRRTNDVKLNCYNCGLYLCWNCKKSWIGTSRNSCGNNECNGMDPVLEFISQESFVNISMYDASTVRTRKYRLCPHCGATYSHNGKNCKMIHSCYRCKKGFCFICLKPEVHGTPTCDKDNNLINIHAAWIPCNPAPLQEQYPQNNNQ